MSKVEGDIRKARVLLELGELEYDMRKKLSLYTDAKEEIEYKINKLIKLIPTGKEDDY